MKKILLTSLFCAGLTGLILFSAACGRKVMRVEVEEEIDLSGHWNDTDSKMVSTEMISDCLMKPWVVDYVEKNSKKPSVIVGTVLNKTNEHIVSETFTKDLERAFINSGKVQVVASRQEREELREERVDMQENASDTTKKEMNQEKAADYMLKGVVNAVNDKYKNKKVVYYQIDLELIDTQSNQKVWIGDKKIKKFIKN